MIDISKRLKTIATQVKYKSIIDIGTDHGYVPIYLCQLDKIDYAIAADINSGPLEKATQNINQYKFANKITKVLSNGFQSIDRVVDTAVIAGMGGNLIIDILKSNYTDKLKQIVVQPQLDIYDVRKFLHTIGFSIDNEEMIIEQNKYYNIISAIKGYEQYAKEQYYEFGKILIEKKSSVLKENIANKIRKYDIIIKELSNKGGVNATKRQEHLKKEIYYLEEVLKWL